MIGERKHVSKEVKEQKKFKSMLRAVTFWPAYKGTYNVGRNAEKRAAKRAAKSIIVK